MTLRTPGSASTLWTAGLLLGIAVLPLVIWHSRLYYAEGGTSPDGPGMLMVALLMTSPMWLGTWMAASFAYLFRYGGSVPVRVGVGTTPLSLVLSVLACLFSIGFVWLAFARVDFWRITRLPFVVHLLGCAIYWQYLRAAAVARSLR
ncbi:hypothetical protein KCP91_01030 [Microvirga sp. SRT01]|uniref:Uncharacterized protein n=1 Tax=Sphingomonas longa TaxID=2778730 RepID=A0ABS2D1Z7_9SPHN|nr:MULTISPECIES: hypothetical protein [Alphaproteobacteria]MBM6574940.1 hypothetical protein [Sphingomonas sp. BT552]MBR7707991.1 hypothetical protein [Microvirga sp. SRT01]